MSAANIEANARGFVAEHTALLAPLVRAAHHAYWEAATAGAPDATRRYAEAKADIKRLHSDPDAAAKVKAWRQSGAIRDPLLGRQLVLLDHAFAANQLPEATIRDLTQREAELEQIFHTFRATLGGEELSNNQLLEILRTERDEERRRRAWEASKQVGAAVAEPLRELVRRRNAAARSLGWDNFYTMSLALQEIEEAELFRILHDFRESSEVPFRRLHAEVDESLAARYRVWPDELRPWHWEDFFGQEAPSVGEVDLDRFFEGQDLVAVAAEFFREIGLPVDDVLERSDLYERENKDQHAFCLDLDREGDVRVLCNMRANEHWMHVLLHELGHAAYDRGLPPELPFLLREPSHVLTTEAVAMYMGRLTRRPEWLRERVAAKLNAGEARDIERQLRLQMLVSTRWIPVMIFFERELYRDADRPDLNALWWDCVEEWQRIRRPEGRDHPDWAAKIHLSIAPVYYQNYLLGELMASQLSARMARDATDSAEDAYGEGGSALGKFLEERVFAPGASLRWDELLIRATGEPLQPRYFVEEFVA